MSHQARTDLSRSRGYNPHSPLGSPLCRTCYCRYTYSYVCFCAAAAASHSYIPHRSTNDGVELPDGTPRGVRDLYPVWLPCFSTSPPSVLFLPYSRGIRASPSHAQPRRGSVHACTVDPCWPRCFAKRKRLYPARSTERGDDNRRATFLVFRNYPPPSFNPSIWRVLDFNLFDFKRRRREGEKVTILKILRFFLSKYLNLLFYFI